MTGLFLAVLDDTRRCLGFLTDLYGKRRRNNYNILDSWILILLFSLPLSIFSQTDLNCDGNSHRFTVTDGSFQDFIVPADPGVLKIRLIAKGGDGGLVNLDGNASSDCVASGGGAALVSGVFKIGDGADEIPRGSIIRSIPGDVGLSYESAINNFTIGAGGGGGSGFLYQVAVGEDWQVLLVAGGGGGAAASQDLSSTCRFASNGGAGRSSTSGGKIGFGGKGGRNGRGGRAGASFTDLATGGGGGMTSMGAGFGCPTDRDTGGGKAGMSEGGQGGTIGVCGTLDANKIVAGGFGFGGGGAGSTEGGGGGGGYSGGGGGSTEPFPELSVGGGGGGGSFVHDMAESPSRLGGASASISEKGFVEYQCITNVPPSADCKQAANPLVVAISTSGEAQFEAIDLNEGSEDPEMGPLTFSASNTLFSCADLGLQTVTLTVTDQGNLSASCVAIVNVIDDEAPRLSCPADIVTANDPGECMAVVEYLTLFSASDNCSVNTSFSASSGTTFPIGSSNVEITAVDPSGNISTCVFSILVEDREPATAVCQDINVALDVSGQATITSTEIDNNSVDNCGIDRLELSQSDFDCGSIGENTIVLTVVDDSGNSSICESKATVSDISLPIAQTRNLIIELDSDGQASITPEQVDDGSNDACGIASLALDKQNFDCSDVGANTITFTVVDNNGNSNSTSAIITVEDRIEPIVEVNNITVQLDANGQFEITPTDVDNNSNDACGIASLSLDISSFDCSDIGTNTIVLHATDNNGNTNSSEVAVLVEDNVIPIALARDIVIQLDEFGQVSILPAQVDDNSNDACGIADISLDKSNFDCSDVGDNVVSLIVVDNNDNLNSVTANVLVEDPVAPVAIAQNIVLYLDPNGEKSITPDAIDNGSNDACGIAELMLDKLDFDCQDLGENELILTVTDNNGNISTTAAIVNVKDTLSPIMECPTNRAILCDASRDPANTDSPIVTDNCGEFSIIFEDEVTEVSCEDELLIMRTWTATDPSSNMTSCQQLITILKDDVLPICTNCPTDLTVSCENVPTVVDLVLTDNCDPNPVWQMEAISTQTADGGCGDFDYTITRTFSISDRCGNTFDHIQTITVIDETPPVISCPADITVLCDVPDPDATGYATATDNCDPNVTLRFTDVVLEGDCNNFCVIERTWEAVDACGNSSTCIQIVTKTSAGLIEEALSVDLDNDGISDPIVLGFSHHTLTLTSDATDCIVDFLPSALGPPRAIPSDNVILDPSSCAIGNIELNAEGKITNPLLEEAILLAVNMRLNSSLGDTPLSSMDCEDMPLVLHFLGRNTNPTINDLADLGNKALSGILGPALMTGLRSTMACVNQVEDICGVQSPFREEDNGNGKFGIRIASAPEEVKLFPNPAGDLINVDISGFEISKAMLNLYRIDGQLLETRRLHDFSAANQRFDTKKYANGLYWVEIRLKTGERFGAKFIISHP